VSDPILVPFGPTRPVPAGYQWCFACDGGADSDDCELCGGKGHWGADDLRADHLRHPEMCREECGAAHEEWTPPMTDEELRRFSEESRDTMRRAKDLLAKYRGKP
jgi:hypothetical protein